MVERREVADICRARCAELSAALSIWGDRMFGFLTRYLPSMAAGQVSRLRWKMSKRGLAVLGVFFFAIYLLVMAYVWLSATEPLSCPINLTNSRRLRAPGTTRADAERIMQSRTSMNVLRQGPADQRPGEPGSFDNPVFRPSEEYAIRWSHPSSDGHYIRVYFDLNDRVKAVEGAMGSDPPPTFFETIRKWIYRE
jgi:hypothetical protein